LLVLAIDPGITTGLAYNNNGIYCTSEYTIKEDLWSLINSPSLWDAVVYERFLTGGRISAPGLYTVNLIGSIEYICFSKKINIYPQMPQKKIAFLKQAKEILGKGHSDHEVDALAHLLSWEYHNVLSKTT